ncbi:MAG: hypothetical protein ACFFG0_02590 [Candidatus Thorarchaeota archaeon]
MGTNRLTKTFDADLELKDAGLVAASAAAQVDSAAKIIDLGSGKVRGTIVIDASAVEVDTGDERYDVEVQVSSSATFASDIYTVAVLPLGDAATLVGDVDMGVGRYELPIVNTIANGVAKRYLRLYTTVAGTIATGVNYTAYLCKD